jgi:L-ascorbate metabolism protein UlaG (beta-lactamase superfamily)
MKITKLEHACLDITIGGSRLIVDPGGWTSPLSSYEGITALVITHVHADHFDSEKVYAIVAANPDVQVFTTDQVASEITGGAVTIASVGEQYSAGDISLEFFGGQHAVIMEGYPPAGADHNFGVLINDTLYYPGDSLTPCPEPHSVLAIPSTAPWLKLIEAVSFMREDTANEVFPTHNNIVNENGENLLNSLLGGAAEQQGKTYHALKPGDSIEA